MVQDVSFMRDWSHRYHIASNAGLTSTAVTRSRIMRLIARTAYSAWLSSMSTSSPALVPGHGDAEVGARLARPALVQQPAPSTHDPESGQVVRRLEPRRHHDDVDATLDSIGVDDAGAAHGGHGPWHQLHVVPLERGVERARDHRPLPRVRVARRHRLAQVGTIGELAGDVVAAELLARVVDPRPGPVAPPVPQRLLQHEPLSRALEPPSPRLGVGRPL